MTPVWFTIWKQFWEWIWVMRNNCRNTLPLCACTCKLAAQSECLCLLWAVVVLTGCSAVVSYRRCCNVEGGGGGGGGQLVRCSTWAANFSTWNVEQEDVLLYLPRTRSCICSKQCTTVWNNWPASQERSTNILQTMIIIIMIAFDCMANLKHRKPQGTELRINTWLIQ